MTFELVVSNPEFFMLFRRNCHTFAFKNADQRAIFYSFSTSRFKTEASFNEKVSFVRSGEKSFETLYNSIVKNYKFLLCTETKLSAFFWKFFISLFMSWFIYLLLFCLLICRNQNKENFAHSFCVIRDKTTSKTQLHELSMRPKNWEFGEYSEHRKLSAFERQIGAELKKLKWFFSRRGMRRISNQEIWIINETVRLERVILRLIFIS